MTRGPRLSPSRAEWTTLDRDLDRLTVLEAGAIYLSRPLLGAGIALAFIVCATLLAGGLTGGLMGGPEGDIGGAPGSLLVITAAALGAYMALNIGANDVANNMGPAVGSGALSMMSAICLAAVFEISGALIAGHDVVDTLAREVVPPAHVAQIADFPLAMIAALLGSALWINLATWLRAPVSTTQAVIGGMLGSVTAAAGLWAFNWPTLGAITLGWVLSPLMGAVVAAGLLAFIKWRVLYVEDKVAAARLWLPVLIGLMAAAFTTYLLLKAPPRFLRPDPALAGGMGLLAGALATVIAVPRIRRLSEGMENRRSALKPLFRLPLVFSAALLSFAHGANDVSNAVGPLAALVQARQAGALQAVVPVPFWVMAMGAAGIATGLLLFGPRLIRMVGSEITRLNPTRAFCISLSAAVTVLIASAFGLPVSSTHIAIGAVFGVGFFREWFMARQGREADPDRRFPVEERRRRRLVRRSHFLTIVGAWLITLPAAAAVSALAFFLLRALTTLF